MKQFLWYHYRTNNTAVFTVLKTLVWLSDVTGVICTQMLRLGICLKTKPKDPPRCSPAAYQPALPASGIFQASVPPAHCLKLCSKESCKHLLGPTTLPAYGISWPHRRGNGSRNGPLFLCSACLFFNWEGKAAGRWSMHVKMGTEHERSFPSRLFHEDCLNITVNSFLWGTTSPLDYPVCRGSFHGGCTSHMKINFMNNLSDLYGIDLVEP